MEPGSGFVDQLDSDNWWNSLPSPNTLPHFEELKAAYGVKALLERSTQSQEVGVARWVQLDQEAKVKIAENLSILALPREQTAAIAEILKNSLTGKWSYLSGDLKEGEMSVIYSGFSK